MRIGVLVVLALAIYIFRRPLARLGMGKHKTLYCLQCGSVGFPKKKMPGSFGIELVLWLCLILPGVIYSLWRWNATQSVCAICESPGLIPPSSPRAIAAANKPDDWPVRPAHRV